MKDYLRNAGVVVLVLILAAAIGLSIEWYRRRGLRSWAAELGGTYESGGILGNVAVPESAAFDIGAKPGDITYHNVVRYSKGGVGYVIAQRGWMYQSFHNAPERHENVVCDVTLPNADFPSLSLATPRDRILTLLLGEDAARIALPDAVPGFDEQFALRGGPASPEVVARLLPPEVQKEMLAQSALLASVQVKGAVIRLHAVHWETGYPHRELAALAERLAAIWVSRARGAAPPK